MSAAAVGDLGDVARRLLALAPWWREEQVDNIRQWLDEAAALPSRQALAREEMRAAQDERDSLPVTHSTHQRWFEVHRAATVARMKCSALVREECSLLTALEVELQWARMRHFARAAAASPQ